MVVDVMQQANNAAFRINFIAIVLLDWIRLDCLTLFFALFLFNCRLLIFSLIVNS